MITATTTTITATTSTISSTTTTTTATTHSIKVKMSNVGESCLVVANVFQLYLEIPLMFEVFLCQRYVLPLLLLLLMLLLLPLTTTATHSIKVKPSNIHESSLVVTNVLQLNLEAQLMLDAFFRQ